MMLDRIIMRYRIKKIKADKEHKIEQMKITLSKMYHYVLSFMF